MATKKYVRPRDRERQKFREFAARHKMPSPKKWGGATMTIRSIEAFEGWSPDNYPRRD